MSGFPGMMYAGDGRNLDPRRRRHPLTVPQMHHWPHRCVVRGPIPGEISRVWLLDAGVTISDIPPKVLAAAASLIFYDTSVLVLAKDPITIPSVRDGLLAAAASHEAGIRRPVTA